MKNFTICALFFDSHVDLAKRCLSSIERELESGHEFVHEFRLGFNKPSQALLSYGRDWADKIASDHRIGSRIYYANDNQFKYPMMRKMFFLKPLTTDYMMWFDDDSFFRDPLPDRWWAEMHDHIRNNDIIGEFWLMPVQGNQMEWIKTQPWCNPRVQDVPPKIAKSRPAFEFCQGAWWVMRSALLERFNWPVPEIKHNGGDSMLGELCRHQRLRMGRFYGGVHINADERGRNSKSKRRGYSENRVGWDYRPGQDPDVSFQQFEVSITTVTPADPPAAIHLFGNDP